LIVLIINCPKSTRGEKIEHICNIFSTMSKLASRQKLGLDTDWSELNK